MSNARYLIVGAGMTAHAAAQAIRSVDPSGEIAMLGDEAAAPYARPPLSKALWTGQEEGSIWLPPVDGLALRTGVRVAEIDRAERRVKLDGGESVGYERLLLATGGSPRRVPSWDDGVVYFRTVADYRRLQALRSGGHVAIVGGGFIGSELAAALSTAGYRVTLLFPEPAIGARLFPHDLGSHVTRYYAEREVEVRAAERVLAVERRGERFAIRTSAGELDADLVVAGLGLVPNDRIAAAAGLAVDDGVVVDERLRTPDPAVFAAGDVARFPCAPLGRTMRVEHEDNANRMGWQAGLAMAGADAVYRHLPFFYSDLFDLGYEAVGLVDARLEVFADWTEPFRKGVLYYLEDARVRGVLTWGMFGRMDAARALIAEPGPHSAATLRGRIAA